MGKWIVGLLVGLGLVFLLGGGLKTVAENPAPAPDELTDEEILSLIDEDTSQSDSDINLDKPEEAGPEINREALEKFYREFDPGRVEMLKRLQRENPAEFEKLLNASWDEMQKWLALKEENPEQFEQMMNERKKQRMENKKPSPQNPEGGEKGKPGMLPKEDINPDEVICFIKEFHPEVAQELPRLRENNPEAFEQAIRGAYYEMMKLRDLKQNDPKQYERVMQQQKMERELKKMSERYHQCKDEKEREALKKQMKDLLGKTFDVMQQGKEKEVKRLEEEVDKLKEKMKTRQEERDKIIDDRLKQMTGEIEENWGG